MLKGVESLHSEQLGVAYPTAIAPPAIAKGPCKGRLRVRLGGDNIRNSTVGEGLLMCLEDLFGCFSGGGDDGGDITKTDSHKRAIDFG